MVDITPVVGSALGGRSHRHNMRRIGSSITKLAMNLRYLYIHPNPNGNLRDIKVFLLAGPTFVSNSQSSIQNAQPLERVR